ncbi:NmrA-like family [Fragilaria crotonensis]|nr:NmrA-like family [Fragilaria crotonensis]
MAVQTTDAGNGKTAVIAGATGYIGKSVVRESVRQGYNTIALVRDASKVSSAEGKILYGGFFEGAKVVECDVCDAKSLTETLKSISMNPPPPKLMPSSHVWHHVLVPKDAYKIDYQATLNCLEAGRSVGARHFVMLSAFCVKNPWLQFQQAKLKFEAALQAQQDMTYTIVRPTAFFKSVSDNWKWSNRGHPSSCLVMEK